jgi:hypothetical protein
MTKRVNILYLQLLVALVLVSGMFSDVKAQDNSDRWVAIEKNATEEYYYDSVTVSREGDSVIVWIKTIYKEKIYDEDDKLMVSAVNALYLYCGKNKYTMQDVEVTYKDGTKKNVDYQEKDKGIKPESLIEKVYNIFCRAEN